MNFEVVADEQSDFDKWVANRQKPSSEPRTAEQEAGKKVFSQNCMSCHAIEGTELKTSGGKVTRPDRLRRAAESCGTIGEQR